MHFIILLFLFLASCSDSLMYNKGTEPISIEILTVSDTILAGERVRFEAKINPSTEHAKRFYWLLNFNKYSRLQFDTVFTKSGIYSAAFYVVDHLDDTLSTNKVTISVARKPMCNSISFECDTKTFKWDCYDRDYDDLTYTLSYEDNNNKTYNAVLKADFWEPGFAVIDDWRISITATNSFKFQSEIYKEGEPCP